jgi:hypothetical protein
MFGEARDIGGFTPEDGAWYSLKQSLTAHPNLPWRM